MQVSSGGGFGPLALPAGDWYVFSAPAAGSAPGTPCADAGLVHVPYGVATSYTWPAGTGTVTVDDLDHTDNRTVFASATPVTYCDGTTHDGTNVVTFTYDSATGEHYATLPAGSWYLAAWRISPYPTCFTTAVNPLTVSGGSSYTVHFDSGVVTTP